MRGVVLDPITGRPATTGLPVDPALIQELAELEQANWKPRLGRMVAAGDAMAADDIFFRDTRRPFVAADQGSVTLSTTDKAMYTASAHPVLGGQYFSMVGKKIKIRAFGKITTAATPGNGTIDVYYGSGADAAGTILASSAAQTLIASQTNISWMIEVWVRCASTGSAGTLRCTGRATFGTAVVAAGTFLIPASASADSSGVDLTAANIISIQFKRSGSTVETLVTQDLEFEALN